MSFPQIRLGLFVLCEDDIQLGSVEVWCLQLLYCKISLPQIRLGLFQNVIPLAVRSWYSSIWSWAAG
jgi:hypothetical protein